LVQVGRENPTHIAVAFDTSEPTQRHIEFPDYKAHRDQMPEDISIQLPYIDQLFDALNKQGTTVIYVTHSSSLADKARVMVEMVDGRLVLN